MSKHTPGPWVAVARTNAYIEIEAPEQHGYSAKKVASTSLTNHEANARLIAAAPDLLEALQAIANGTEFWDAYPPEHPYGKAKAAMLKARQA
jgi:hypothetical protein